MSRRGTGIRLGWLAGMLLLGALYGKMTVYGAGRGLPGTERAAGRSLLGTERTAEGSPPGAEYVEEKNVQTDPEGIAAKNLPGGDWSEIDLFLQQQEGWETKGLGFGELMEALMEGNKKGLGQKLITALRQSLTAEISHGTHLAGELLALGLAGAVFANFSHIFTGSQISDTAFFMTYLLAATVLVSAFSDGMEIAQRVLVRQMEFLKVLIPCYFPIAAWAGGSLSAAAWMEFFLFLIAAVQWLYLRLLLPLTRVYLLMVMAGNLAKEDMLSRLTQLLQSLIRWGMRSLIGLVAGFQLIQGIVLPYADCVQTAGVQKLLQAIPGVGDGAGAVTKMLLGTGVLMKNTMGAAAVAVLIVLSLVPLLKLAVLLLLYRFVAGVLQPVGDRRLIACIGSVAEGQKMLLGLAASALLLFSVTIALVCVGTNGAYLGV